MVENVWKYKEPLYQIKKELTEIYKNNNNDNNFITVAQK